MKKKLAVLIILLCTVFSIQVFSQDKITGTQIGDIFLDYESFNAETIDGKSIKSKDFEGKYVFVDFWATWCPPCEGEFPFLARVEKKFVGDKFMMFGISLDNDVTKIEPFKKKYGVTYQNIADGKGWNSPWATKYGIRSIPSNFLLDPKGKIIATSLRGYHVEYEVSKALGIESPVVYILDSDKILNDTNDEKRFEKVAENIAKAFKLEPDMPEGYEKLGDIQLDQNHDAKAREQYEKAMKNPDKSPDKYLIYRLHEKIAESYAGEGNWDAVVNQYGKIMELLPEGQKISAQAGLVSVLDKHERKKEGIEQRKILLEMFDKQPEKFRTQYAQFRAKLEEEIKNLEKEISDKKEPEKENKEEKE